MAVGSGSKVLNSASESFIECRVCVCVSLARSAFSLSYVVFE